MRHFAWRPSEIAAYLGAALYRVPVELIAREVVTGDGLPRFPWATWSA
jgi:phosphoribosylaminoimidazole-succinocarboxamide synthase